MPRSSGILIVLWFVVITVSCVRGADKLPNQYEAGDIKVAAARGDEPVIDISIKKAAEHLDHGTIAWTQQKKCVSCHTNGTYLFIRPSLTPTLGVPLAETRNFFVDQLASELRQAARVNQQHGHNVIGVLQRVSPGDTAAH